MSQAFINLRTPDGFEIELSTEDIRRFSSLMLDAVLSNTDRHNLSQINGIWLYTLESDLFELIGKYMRLGHLDGEVISQHKLKLLKHEGEQWKASSFIECIELLFRKYQLEQEALMFSGSDAFPNALFQNFEHPELETEMQNTVFTAEEEQALLNSIDAKLIEQAFDNLVSSETNKQPGLSIPEISPIEQNLYSRSGDELNVTPDREDAKSVSVCSNDYAENERLKSLFVERRCKRFVSALPAVNLDSDISVMKFISHIEETAKKKKVLVEGKALSVPVVKKFLREQVEAQLSVLRSGRDVAEGDS